MKIADDQGGVRAVAAGIFLMQLGNHLDDGDACEAFAEVNGVLESDVLNASFGAVGEDRNLYDSVGG